jgi:uncharacterized protein (DUF885 family)
MITLQAKTTSREDQEATYQAGLELIEAGVDVRSAFKQAASQAGIPYGEEMGRFVHWAEARFSNNQTENRE